MSDSADILSRLTAEFGYPEQGAKLVLEKLMASAPHIQQAFRQWWHSGDVPDIEEGGYNVQTLMRNFGMSPIAALLTLDYLRREPEAARAALARGVDRIVR